jgi:riboflavin kinase/FMN adenylyltransferase
MQLHYNINELPVFKNAVITIGTFDGVHQGHRKIIQKLKQQADKIKGETVIITFHPHPRKVVSSTILGVRLINTLEEKIELLDEAEIDHLVIVPFTDAFANQPAEEYLKNFLIDKLHPHTIIIGYDHHFGKDRLGNYLLLEKRAADYHYELQEIPKHVLDEIAISSTKIREAILNHEVETANKLLGYDFFFSGEVVDGDKLGRKLGYPTANLKMTDDEKIIPGNGIYAVYVTILKRTLSKKNNSGTNSSTPDHHTTQKLKGMMSIGFRPTVDGSKRVVEVNIFDFDEVIYGSTLRVTVKKYLRAEVKFNSLDELVVQIGRDKLDSLKIL